MAYQCDIQVVAPDETIVQTIVCHGTSSILDSYIPMHGDPQLIEQKANQRNGSRITNATFPNVRESAKFWWIQKNDQAFLDHLHALQRAFETAKERQRTQRGNRVFIVFKLDRMSVAFRSEIYSASVLVTPQDGGIGWMRQVIAYSITMVRHYDWESTVLTALPLTSQATAKTTNGVTISNHWDSGHSNYVHIDASDIQGTHRTPIRLEITRTSGSSQTNEVWVTRYSDPTATLNPILEGENFDPAFASGTILSNSAYSNGNASQHTRTYSSSTYDLMGVWTLSSALLQNYGGMPVRIFAKFSTTYPVWMQVKLYYQNVTVLDQTPIVQQTTLALQDLGIINLPPWNVAGSSVGLSLRFFCKMAINDSFTLDYFALVPAEDCTVYTSRGYGLNNGETLVDDGITGMVSKTGGGLHIGNFIKRPDNRLLLIPNEQQRLLIFMRDSLPNETMTVKAFYRERRLTL